jgi:hypothetical protein
MLLSALAAWNQPFEVLLFSYAILGPLHYLTEISWLHDKKWFSKAKHDWIVPCLVSAALTILYIAMEIWGQKEALSREPEVLGLRIRGGWVACLLLVSIAASMAAAFVGGSARRALLIAALLVAGFAFLQSVTGRIVVNVMLTTVIHVFVFTSCFILYGALKSKSVSGYWSWAVHLGLGALLLMPWKTADAPIPLDLARRLDVFGPVVDGMNYYLSRPSTVPEGRGPLIAAMRFLAFAYTYHYLNWFSKTGIIRWHEVSRERLAILVAAWIGSLILYAYDWRIGFIALLALSLAHVLLEFPLNWRTFVGIGSELRSRVASKPAVAP